MTGQEVLEHFGRRVRAERTARHLTQEELAARVPGLTPLTIHRAEHAKSNLGLASAAQIAAALGIPLGVLLGGGAVTGFAKDDRVRVAPAWEDCPVEWQQRGTVLALVPEGVLVERAGLDGSRDWSVFRPDDLIREEP